MVLQNVQQTTFWKKRQWLTTLPVVCDAIRCNCHVTAADCLVESMHCIHLPATHAKQCTGESIVAKTSSTQVLPSISKHCLFVSVYLWVVCDFTCLMLASSCRLFVHLAIGALALAGMCVNRIVLF